MPEPSASPLIAVRPAWERPGRDAARRSLVAISAELTGCVGIETVEGDLARVEDALTLAVQTGSSFFTEATGHLAAVPGKRLRPLLALSAAYAGTRAPARPPAVSDRVITAAVAVELLHLGSLCHDDVIDQADTRRGAPTVNARWSNTLAVLAGDFLLAAASQAGASLGAEEAGIVSATLAGLCKGQALETKHLFDVERDEASYTEAIAGKTAGLLAAACRMGALEAGLDRPAIDALAAFGHNLGMAFQIVDDILDLTGSDRVLGKPTGKDLLEGVYTLPVIHALRESAELKRLLGRPLDEEGASRARSLVLAGCGIASARTAAEGYTRCARQALLTRAAGLDRQASTGLARLALFLLERTA